MINRNSIIQLKRFLDARDIKRLKDSAEAADKVEKKWISEVEKLYKELDKKIAKSLMDRGELPKDISFADLIFMNSYEAMKIGLKTAKNDRPEIDKSAKKRLAKGVKPPPKAVIPRSLSDLMEIYDQYRKRKRLPKRQKDLAEKLKQAYLKKTQSVFEKYSRDFRAGSEQTKLEIVQKVQEAGRTTVARAKTIVETETTNYYNQTRKEYYDQSADVTHYLFVAVRDMATTKWCKTRHGLVYEKGSVYLKRERPACHWNCRSELLPLTRDNPVHAKLIDDASLQRKNNNPAPLPPGWNRDAA